MNERDRLIELIKNSRTNEAFDMLTVDIDTAIDMPHGDEYLADYLLAKGVIVPPVRIGQKVYIVDTYDEGYVYEGEITNLEYNIYTTPREHIGISAAHPKFGEIEYVNRIDLLLDKTVFLSREDAEKALHPIGPDDYPEIMRHFTEVE